MAETTHVYPRINTARSIVQTERDILDREIDALEAFRTRLGQLETTVNGENFGTGGLVQTVPAAGIPPQRIRRAYRETVLDMAHYEQEYDEPLLENVEAEFNPQIRALFESSQPLRPIQYRVVDRAVDEAISRRRKMVRELRREDDSLNRIADRLAEIERGYIGLAETNGSRRSRSEKLERLRTDCDSLASKRQETIHQRPTAQIAGIGARSLVAYLYGDHDHRFPALREIAEVASGIVQDLNR